MDKTDLMKAELYALRLSENIDFSDFTDLLVYTDPVKRDRIRRFYRDEDKLRCLLGDLLVRMLLVKRLGVVNDQLLPQLSDYGKPYFPDSGIHFNISHAGDWVVCAIHDRPVGVDVEQVIPIDLSISASFFAAPEHADILKAIDRDDRFFDFWSLKESFIKQIGKGLSQALNSFTVRFTEQEIRIECDGAMLEDVFLRQFALEDGYKLAVCTANAELPVAVNSITTQQIHHFFNNIPGKINSTETTLS